MESQIGSVIKSIVLLAILANSYSYSHDKDYHICERILDQKFDELKLQSVTMSAEGLVVVESDNLYRIPLENIDIMANRISFVHYHSKTWIRAVKWYEDKLIRLPDRLRGHNRANKLQLFNRFAIRGHTLFHYLFDNQQEYLIEVNENSWRKTIKMFTSLSLNSDYRSVDNGKGVGYLFQYEDPTYSNLSPNLITVTTIEEKYDLRHKIIHPFKVNSNLFIMEQLARFNKPTGERRFRFVRRSRFRAKRMLPSEDIEANIRPKKNNSTEDTIDRPRTVTMPIRTTTSINLDPLIKDPISPMRKLNTPKQSRITKSPTFISINDVQLVQFEALPFGFIFESKVFLWDVQKHSVIIFNYVSLKAPKLSRRSIRYNTVFMEDFFDCSGEQDSLENDEFEPNKNSDEVEIDDEEETDDNSSNERIRKKMLTSPKPPDVRMTSYLLPIEPEEKGIPTQPGHKIELVTSAAQNDNQKDKSKSEKKDKITKPTTPLTLRTVMFTLRELRPKTFIFKTHTKSIGTQNSTKPTRLNVSTTDPNQDHDDDSYSMKYMVMNFFIGLFITVVILLVLVMRKQNKKRTVRKGIPKKIKNKDMGKTNVIKELSVPKTEKETSRSDGKTSSPKGKIGLKSGSGRKKAKTENSTSTSTSNNSTSNSNSNSNSNSASISVSKNSPTGSASFTNSTSTSTTKEKCITKNELKTSGIPKRIPVDKTKLFPNAKKKPSGTEIEVSKSKSLQPSSSSPKKSQISMNIKTINNPKSTTRRKENPKSSSKI